MTRIFIAVTGIALALAAAVRLGAPSHGLHVQYVATTTTEQPATVSATWTGWLTVVRSGEYRIVVDTGGTSTLFVDHTHVAPGEPLYLARGTHHVFLGYVGPQETPRMVLRWGRPGDALSPVPVFDLSERRQWYLTAIAEAALPGALAVAQWTWIAVLIAVAVRLLGRALRSLHQRFAREDDWETLRWILGASLALDAVGLWWGLPAIWVPNEFRPIYIVEGLSRWFVHGWSDVYPPLHYYVLTIVLGPLLLLWRWGRIDFANVNTLAAVLLRVVSVAAAVGTILATRTVARLAFGRRAGLFGAAIMAVVAPFLYYAKTANVDVPYLFWFALSMVWYLRTLQRGATRDYVLFAVCASLCVCTKDQAYGLYALLPLVLIAENGRAARLARMPRPWLRAAIERRMWIGGAAAALVFAAIYLLPFNASGFAAHVRYIVGDGSVPYRVFDSTLGGHVRLLVLTLRLTQESFGWPFTAAVVAGVVLALKRPSSRRIAVWLLVPIASYYLTFVNVINYNYDRFMLPVCVLLAPFGGLALDALTRGARARRWRMAVATGAMAYTVLYAGTVDFLMVRDSRYDVERWLTSTVRPGEIVGVNGIPEYIPRLEGFNSPDVSSIADLERVRPAYVVINTDYDRTAPPDTDLAQLVAALQRGDRGYVRVRRFRTQVPWSWLPGGHPDLVGTRETTAVFSTLRNINPTIDVFRRNISAN